MSPFCCCCHLHLSTRTVRLNKFLHGHSFLHTIACSHVTVLTSLLTCSQGEVWSHSDGTGNFDVIDARNYSAVHENVLAHVNISGHGKLLFDYGVASFLTCLSLFSASFSAPFYWLRYSLVFLFFVFRSSFFSSALWFRFTFCSPLCFPLLLHPLASFLLMKQWQLLCEALIS